MWVLLSGPSACQPSCSDQLSGSPPFPDFQKTASLGNVAEQHNRGKDLENLFEAEVGYVLDELQKKAHGYKPSEEVLEIMAQARDRELLDVISKARGNNWRNSACVVRKNEAVS